uniref:Uncharacterized protein n=1 Tax=Anguilla anguilla TaxID=7936 RepID=A0A0E9R425_ANGAN
MTFKQCKRANNGKEVGHDHSQDVSRPDEVGFC